MIAEINNGILSISSESAREDTELKMWADENISKYDESGLSMTNICFDYAHAKRVSEELL